MLLNCVQNLSKIE